MIFLRLFESQSRDLLRLSRAIVMTFSVSRNVTLVGKECSLAWQIEHEDKAKILCTLNQGRNKVHEIRDHSPGILDHNTWDRDQQCFSGIRDQNCERFWDQGSKFPMFLWSGIKILNVFVIRDQNLGQKYRISYEKIYLVATLLNCHDFVSCTDQKHSCSIVAFEIVELVFFFWVWSDR